jgi:hypothetical protein
MSTIKVDTITDEAGTGAPDFPQGMTGDGSSLTGLATAAQGALATTALQASSSLPAANLTGTLPAIDGSALTGVGASTTFGDVGTYAMVVVAANFIQGATYAGSFIRILSFGNKTAYTYATNAESYTNPGPAFNTSTVSLSGTWQMMSRGKSYGTTVQYALAVRIS